MDLTSFAAKQDLRKRLSQEAFDNILSVRAMNQGEPSK
jgi:hypothetical protein